MLVIFTSKNILRRQTGANIIIYLLDHAHEAPLANIKVERQRWPQDKTVDLGLCSTVSRILLQNQDKLAEISFLIISYQNLYLFVIEMSLRCFLSLHFHISLNLVAIFFSPNLDKNSDTVPLT